MRDRTHDTDDAGADGEAESDGAEVSCARERTLARPRRRRRRAVVGLTVLVVVGVLGALVAWVAADLLTVRRSLETASGLVQDLEDEIAAGDEAAALKTLDDLQARTDEARDASDGVHWSIVSSLPVARPNLQAVQTVTAVVDDLATDALPVFAESAALAGPAGLSPVDGRIDLAPVVASAPRIVSADASVQRGVADLRGIETDDLVGPLASAVVDLRGTMDGVASASATAARAVQLAPPMLGADGPRRYLLLVQNNAEPRASGGIPAWVLLVTADAGVLELTEQHPASEFQLDSPALTTTAAEQALFGDDLAQKMVDVNFTPDFPRTAELARALWQQKDPGEIDGVLSVDPVALAGIMKTTGALTLPDGHAVDSETIAGYLMNGIYLEVPDQAQQDALFTFVSSTMFSQVVGGSADVAAAFPSMAQSGRDGRLMVWSAHPEEQALLEPTVLSGALGGDASATAGDMDQPRVGVFLNDGTAGKLGYYLDRSVSVETTECFEDGSQALTVTVDLTSTAPTDAAASLPRYVTGVSDTVPPGDLRTNILVYAPTGGRIDGVTAGGEPVGVQSELHDGLFVVGVTSQLSPGGSASYEYDIVTGPDQKGPVLLRSTPGARDTQIHVAGAGCKGV